MKTHPAKNQIYSVDEIQMTDVVYPHCVKTVFSLVGLIYHMHVQSILSLSSPDGLAYSRPEKEPG